MGATFRPLLEDTAKDARERLHLRPSQRKLSQWALLTLRQCDTTCRKRSPGGASPKREITLDKERNKSTLELVGIEALEFE
jgi:hypothetical protein